MARRHDWQQSTTSALRAPVLYDARDYPEWVRWLGVLGVVLALFVALLAQRHANHELIAFALAGAAIGRGIGQRRPLIGQHLVTALGLLLLAGIEREHVGFAQVAIALAGVVAFWSPPPPTPGTPAERHRIRSLVNTTRNDPLAPFSLRSDKSYVFSDDGLAAVAYRVRLGVLVVSGDPIGAVESQPEAARAVVRLAERNGWRLGVIGANEQWRGWWCSHGARSLMVGRDVVVDVATFTLSGRRFRNLRQAVQRSHNAGVTTAIYDEMDLTEDLVRQLRDIVAASHRNSKRGFAMILDGLLTPTRRGTVVAVAFDRDGKPVAFHRFGTADAGREVSQDLPWRAPGAPNGVDERLTHDTILWARERGASRLSLSFAAFPDLYENPPSSGLGRLSYWATHRLDRFIRLESLYRYLRKFHALGERRYVVFRLRDLLPVALAMLTLEFSSYRSEWSGPRAWWRRLSGRGRAGKARTF